MGMTHQVGLRDFGAFEDEGHLKPRILVVNDDEVTVQGQFQFNAIRGDFLSQTWKRVKSDDEGDDSWKIKSHMFAITVAGHLRVPRNRTAIALAIEDTFFEDFPDWKEHEKSSGHGMLLIGALAGCG